MKLIINKDRSVIPVGTWGTKNENDYEILEFEFPEELENYNKRIVYYLDVTKPWDAIVDNKAYITNAITSAENVKAYIWCTKENSERPADTDFRSQEFEMHFYQNENADGVVPAPVQVDGFNTMLTAMNAKIDEVDALEQTILQAETERQENENTRISNESTRQSNESTRESNEQTRQEQEAERERKTAEAIVDIQDKTAEYNANAEEKTNEFNQNATQKTNDFNSNYTQKVNDFDSNATNKTNAFNSNATEETTAFNNNASTKTSEFNSNAESKTSAFNDNATQKTTNFDNNATEKTDEFNTNAQNKIDEYDEHIVEYQAQIDELQEEVDELSENMPWNTTEQATEINVTDAAKYSKNKLELFGNTEQASYTGKNLSPISSISTNDTGNINRASGELGSVLAGKTYTISFKNNSEYTSNVQVRIFNGTNFTLQTGGNLIPNSIKSYTFTASEDGNIYLSAKIPEKVTNIFTEIQLEQGSNATDYEPYVGGVPSPNPDYPQDIHVVTGENTIEVQGKNLFNKNVERKNAFSTGDIGQVVGYGNSSASYSYVNCAKVEANKTYTLSWKIDGTKGSTLNRTSRIVDSNNIVLEKFATWINNTTHITFTPQNTGYLVLTTDISSVDIQIEQGTTSTPYEPYREEEYELNLGSLELCKIGDYQDYLYRENGNWYKYGAVGKVVLDGINNVFSSKTGNSGNVYAYELTNAIPTPSNSTPVNVLVKYFKPVSYSDLGNYDTGITSYQKTTIVRCKFRANSNITTLELANTWLTTHNVPIYYPLAAPTTTQITDTTLISQLDAIYERLKLVKGTNHITVTAEDLAPNMKLTYMQDLKSKLDNIDSRLALLE